MRGGCIAVTWRLRGGYVAVTWQVERGKPPVFAWLFNTCIGLSRDDAALITQRCLEGQVAL